jgi:hypothetical protein
VVNFVSVNTCTCVGDICLTLPYLDRLGSHFELDGQPTGLFTLVFKNTRSPLEIPLIVSITSGPLLLVAVSTDCVPNPALQAMGADALLVPCALTKVWDAPLMICSISTNTSDSLSRICFNSAINESSRLLSMEESHETLLGVFPIKQ